MSVGLWSGRDAKKVRAHLLSRENATAEELNFPTTTRRNALPLGNGSGRYVLAITMGFEQPSKRSSRAEMLDHNFWICLVHADSEP